MNQPVYLALDTSTPIGSVAVGTSTGVLAEAVLGVHSRHSEALLPAIDFLLANAQLRKQEISRVIVGGGPGSFTGLRIAGATAKALASALEVPLFAYSGLAALAAGVAIAERDICALFDARRGEVYAACYRFPGMSRLETLMEPAACSLDEVLSAIDPRTTLFVGEATLQYGPQILQNGGSVAPPHWSLPRASALLWLSDVAPAEGEVADVRAWEPLYLRGSGAERMRAR